MNKAKYKTKDTKRNNKENKKKTRMGKEYVRIINRSQK